MSSSGVTRYAAFTNDPGGGNPAGVVLDAAGLSEQRMLALAAEVGYSETAFVVAADDTRRHYTLRYYSPKAEVAFCGHATVAAAVALAGRGGNGTMVFDTRAGTVPVEVGTEDGGPRATVTSVSTRSRPADEDAVHAALTALRWAPDDVAPDFPPHVAFAGNDHLMLAARSRERLADLDYDFEALAAVSRDQGWTTVHLFCPGEPGVFHARDPFPAGGVVEDPATGAAAAAFGGYLRELGLVTTPETITVRQGEDMGRPSELRVFVDPGQTGVRVSGQAVEIPE